MQLLAPSLLLAASAIAAPANSLLKAGVACLGLSTCSSFTIPCPAAHRQTRLSLAQDDVSPQDTPKNFDPKNVGEFCRLDLSQPNFEPLPDWIQTIPKHSKTPFDWEPRVENPSRKEFSETDDKILRLAKVFHNHKEFFRLKITIKEKKASVLVSVLYSNTQEYYLQSEIKNLDPKLLISQIVDEDWSEDVKARMAWIIEAAEFELVKAQKQPMLV
jgi:hypothetical protein